MSIMLFTASATMFLCYISLQADKVIFYWDLYLLELIVACTHLMKIIKCA